MKFDLLFMEADDGTGDKSPFASPVAYVYVSKHHTYADEIRGGRIMLTSESTSAHECHKKIDELIEDLQKLKHKVSKKLRP